MSMGNMVLAGCSCTKNERLLAFIKHGHSFLYVGKLVFIQRPFIHLYVMEVQ